MDRAMVMLETSKTKEDYLKTSNYFYRISQATKTDWLSSYYYAFMNAQISFLHENDDIKNIVFR